MRIFHLIKHGVRGNGSVHLAVDLACEQADRGHDVWFVCSRGSYNTLLAAHGVHVVEVTEPIDVATGLRSLIAQLRLSRRHRPDVLHAHMMSSAVLGAVVAALVRRPLIATMHNSFDRHSWLMRVARRVVAVSAAEARLLVARRYPRRQVVPILNGVAGSARASLPFDDIGPLHRPSVMTLCGLHPRKRVEDVIDAFATVHEEFSEWHLNIVGSGPSQPDLVRKTHALGLTASVHFMGATLTPLPLLRQSEIFALASLAEPCGLALMEARVAGCAAIGTAVGGIPEVLDYGQAGQLVPPADPGSIARVMRSLMADPDELGRWREAATADISQLTVARMADDYQRVYSSVARRRRSARPRSGRPDRTGAT